MPPVATRSPSPSPALAAVVATLVATASGALLVPGPAVLGQDRGSDVSDSRPPGSRPPEDGDTVTVTGRVTDARGRAVPGVHVVFEAYRTYFSLRHFERRAKDFRRVETRTDETGRYRVEWLWDDYFNRFRVGVERPGRSAEVGAAWSRTARDGRDTGAPDDASQSPYLVLQTDLGPRLARSGSAVVPLVVEDIEVVETVRRFETSLSTEDQRRVYRDLGYPDEVRVLELADGREASWWYFERGEVYRFADGELEEIEPFEPVTGF